MKKTSNIKINKFRCWLIVSVVFLVTVGMIGCSNPLEVENPNSVLEEDLGNPKSATAIANGALALVSYSASEMLALYSCASDEGTWIGSRDGFNQIVRGNIGDHNNEFTDSAWEFICEARWMADKAITQLSEFDSADDLDDRESLLLPISG